ncbi:MAG TPA: hypothetical protein HA340_06870 [Candidatus Thalassarchaeaceae archaeon]|jgi:hypothetical protein|nr:MAG TPA: hypothetical protein D7H97_06840 [Candidatus Poseidoniales archaeon]HIH83651.1 hypothetical protein [Candidatus Thalassarchaeaceae archaeon]|tara:strand:- start:932 stop:1540 length:609 start_codon:yes stop_codon:yes gene_type:complete
MILSTTVVTIMAGLTVLFGAVSRFEATRPYFKSLGMSNLVSEPVSRRMLVGTISSIFGGLVSAVWIWVIQRQEVIGQTSLCAASSGCASALSEHTFNIIPFTNLQYGLFFILWFSILLFLALSVYLEPGWSSNETFLTMGRIGAIIGSLIALVMLVVHLARVEDAPALCPLCLILVAANFVTLYQFHLLYNSYSDGTWNSKN